MNRDPSRQAAPPSAGVTMRGEDADPLEGLQSVLLHLEEKAGTMPRVMLHDLPSEGAPVVKGRGQPATGAATGAFHQYQILGEVARGGVGIVYKARDFDIGRDVAMKMLKDELAEDPVRVQKFLEEAQIAGQLQHPGILPVYAVGLRNKETPYFTMKFIKGGTLAAALQRRADPKAGLRRLLEIFDRVAQAMAYAHARGVVHRDLKPANILVGAYGEVQVMDWGMAKVLERGGVADELRSRQSQESVISVIEPVRTIDVGSASIIGSVMGTPAYMAPEQAQGQIASIDTRTDVFALGGILCEILTGAPPYRANPDYSVVVQAARCMLDDAYDRLDACGADAQLIELTKSCLVPALTARPRDAGVLAQELGAYLAGVEERARQAQLDAVKAHERERAAEVRARASKRLAEQEMRAKRITMGLSAAVIGIVLLGFAGWFSVQSEERQRMAGLQQAVSSHLDEALALLADAQSDPTDAATWQKALAAAQKADAAGQAGDAPAATALRVAAVLERIETGAAQAREQAAARARDASLVASLEDLTSRKGPEFDPAVLEAGYAEAYRAYGLEIDTGAVAPMVQQIRAARIQDALIAGLDEWAWLRSRYELGPAGTRDRPSEVARRADVDPWRKRVRRAVQTGNTVELRHLAESADVASMQLGTLHLLASALDNVDEQEAAIQLLRRAVGHHPADFWSNLHLAYWLTRREEPAWAEAVRYYTAATALRPDSARTLNNLGIALQESKHLDDAIEAYRRALALDATLATAWNNLGTALLDKKEFDPAIAAFDEAIALQSRPAAALYGKGNALLAKGDAPKAIEAFKQALRVKEDFPRARQQLFAALADAGRQEEAVAMAEAALREHPETSWAQRQLAHAQLRRSNYEGAIRAFQRAIELGDEDGVATHDLGSAWAQLGMWDRARACYAKALDVAPHDAQFHFDLGWAEKNWGAWHDALRHFQETIDLDATYAPAYDERGELFLWMGRYGEAEAEFLRTLEYEPEALYGHSHLGQLHGTTTTVEEAIDRYERCVQDPSAVCRAAYFSGLSTGRYQRGALEDAYRAIKSALRAAPDQASYHEQLGRILAYQMPFAAAVRRYEATAPGRTAQTEAYFYNGLGTSYTGRGLLADAAQAYDGARTRSPENPAPLANLAGALDLDAERERALELLDACLKLAPYYLSAHQRLGYTLGRTLDAAAADVAYGERVPEAPNTCRAYFLLGLGNALYARGSVDAALAAWDEAMTLNQMVAATSGASIALAYWNEFGDRVRARDLLVRVLRLAPRYPAASQYLGALLGVDMKPAEARSTYEKLVPHRPGINEASFLTGLAQAQLGEGALESALELVRQALDLEPKLVAAHALHVTLLTQLGRLAEAIQVAEGYLAASPYEVAVWGQLAQAHQLAGASGASVEALDAALTHAARAPGLLVMRGMLLEQDGRWDEALETYQRASQCSAGFAIGRAESNWRARWRARRVSLRTRVRRRPSPIATTTASASRLSTWLTSVCGAALRSARPSSSGTRSAMRRSRRPTRRTTRCAPRRSRPWPPGSVEATMPDASSRRNERRGASEPPSACVGSSSACPGSVGATTW